MNELLRMQYIDAMGIDMFVPRRQLLNAKDSVLCELPVRKEFYDSGKVSFAPLTEVANDSRNEHEPNSRSNASGAAVKSILDDFAKPTKNSRSEVEVLSTSSSAVVAPSLSESEGSKQESVSLVENVNGRIDRSVSAEKAEFTLGLWRIGENLQIIDSRCRGDALPTEVLLQNILRSHDYISSPKQVPPQEIINWPLAASALPTDSFDVDDDQSWSAAHEMVMSFLEGRLLPKPVKTFWLMGADACKAVVGDNIDFNEHVYKSISIDSFAAEALVLPSLRDCLTSPSNKKVLWATINDFVDQCGSSSSEKDSVF